MDGKAGLANIGYCEAALTAPKRRAYNIYSLLKVVSTMRSCRAWVPFLALSLSSLGPLVLAQDTPADKPAAKSTPPRETVAKPLTERQRKQREAKLRKELEGPYKKWINEDVVYIITDEERQAWNRLATDK